jgi:hypothetical protein
MKEIEPAAEAPVIVGVERGLLGPRSSRRVGRFAALRGLW